MVRKIIVDPNNEDQADKIVDILKRTRRISPGWTFEAIADIEAVHGIDVENELVKLLSAELVKVYK